MKLHYNKIRDTLKVCGDASSPLDCLDVIRRIGEEVILRSKDLTREHDVFFIKIEVSVSGITLGEYEIGGIINGVDGAVGALGHLCDSIVAAYKSNDIAYRDEITPLGLTLLYSYSYCLCAILNVDEGSSDLYNKYKKVLKLVDWDHAENKNIYNSFVVKQRNADVARDLNDYKGAIVSYLGMVGEDDIIPELRRRFDELWEMENLQEIGAAFGRNDASKVEKVVCGLWHGLALVFNIFLPNEMRNFRRPLFEYTDYSFENYYRKMELSAMRVSKEREVYSGHSTVGSYNYRPELEIIREWYKSEIEKIGFIHRKT